MKEYSCYSCGSSTLQVPQVNITERLTVHNIFHYAYASFNNQKIYLALALCLAFGFLNVPGRSLEQTSAPTGNATEMVGPRPGGWSNSTPSIPAPETLKGVS